MLIPESNTNYELLPVGTYQATCIEFVHMGTQPTAHGPKNQVRLAWEIAGEHMENGKPFIVSRLCTFSAHEKASFRAIVEGMIGGKLDKTFDTKALIGLTCLLSVQHNTNGETTYVNVE